MMGTSWLAAMPRRDRCTSPCRFATSARRAAGVVEQPQDRCVAPAGERPVGVDDAQQCPELGLAQDGGRLLGHLDARRPPPDVQSGHAPDVRLMFGRPGRCA